MRIITIGHSTSSNIYIASEYVSSNHAELLLMDNGDIFLTDKGSRNGTFLFGKRINPNQEIPVRRGDRIDFDNVPLNWSQVPSLPPLDPTKVKGVYGIGKNAHNKYILTGDTVSRFHATLKEMKNGKWFIQDHSTNGTFINGSRIPSNQDYQVKKGDAIVCGNVPLANPIRGAVIPIKPILAGVAAVAVICCLVLLKPWEHIKGNKGNDIVVINNDTTDTKREPPVTQNIDPNYATVCIYNVSRIKVVFDDDVWKFKEIYDLLDMDEKLNRAMDLTYAVSGTAFFVSDQGLLLTNRHVVDVLYAMQHEEEESLKLVNVKRQVYEILEDLINDCMDDDGVKLWLPRVASLKIRFEVENLFLGIGYPERNYQSWIDEFDRVTLVKTSDKDDVDLAVLRLNTYKTPEHAQSFDLSQAIMDTGKLKLGEDYYTVGYPAGLALAKEMDKNKVTASYGTLRLKQRPGNSNLMFDGSTSIGGQSGSAIYNKDSQLIAVLYGGIEANNTTLACPISHAIELIKDAVASDDRDQTFIKSNNIKK